MDMCYLACAYRTPSGYCGSTGGAATCPYCQKKQTNADRVRAMTDEELAEWYWWMLHYVQGYTDSRVALREWLKQDYTTFVAQEYEKDLNDRLNREGISP